MRLETTNPITILDLVFMPAFKLQACQPGFVGKITKYRLRHMRMIAFLKGHLAEVKKASMAG
jgi:hypothetical protein